MSARIIAGVDPGLSGAAALLSDDGDLKVLDMPTFEVKVGRTKRRVIDIHTLARWFDFNAASISKLFIESVHAGPRDGARQAFAFGRSFGVAEMAAAANMVPMHYVEPAVWKRAMGLTGDKDASRRLASRLLPRHAALWSRVKDDGRAEAALIALYGSAHADA